ncbi:hypothetical protein JOB18_044606 [Solea senegalensis]|uniref:Uncharacterized protein n=1 Tax=Solea senegalensis TaxID=28829 RepID=A0AAV6SGN6_SOLSE|nr:hypothetical protein JOB18_044606 [Solea senegalensis]
MTTALTNRHRGNRAPSTNGVIESVKANGRPRPSSKCRVHTHNRANLETTTRRRAPIENHSAAQTGHTRTQAPVL